MKRYLLAAALSLVISGSSGAQAQLGSGQRLDGNSDVASLTSTSGVNASVGAPGVQLLAQEADENLTATDGNATTRGPGNASAGPGSVTRSNGKGVALLGPDGTYRVTDSAPADVTISGDTDVLSPPAAPADPGAAPSESNVPTCASYGSWYDSQIAYENAGLTAADPALVESLDPDYDGIACEEGMS